MKTCYLVWTHTDNSQILRVLGRIRQLSPDSTILVHHDPNGGELDEVGVLDLGGDVRIIYAAEPVRWGDMSLVNAVLRCLRWAEANIEYDWLVHLSGQDYPLRPLADLEHKLATEGYDGYIVMNRLGTQDEVRGDHSEPVRRYFSQWYQLPNFPAARVITGRARKIVRLGRRGGSGMGTVGLKLNPRGGGIRVSRRARRTPFGDTFPCWKGSLWVLLSREAATYYLATVDARPALLKYYERTINPDESITATVLANAPYLRISPDPLRYTSWSGGPHPQMLTVEHLPAMFESGAFFARKFPNDTALYDRIDAHVDAQVAVDHSIDPAKAADEGPTAVA